MIQYSTINDAWGNKQIYRKNTIDNFTNKQITKNEESVAETVAEPVVQNAVPAAQPILIEKPYKEHFNNNSCSYTEHLKNCEHCRNQLREYFDNSAPIKIYGIHITKDMLKIIFIILIILIFIILLSMINISFNDAHTKYIMVPSFNNKF
jgi:hypothetical protein